MLGSFSNSAACLIVLLAGLSAPESSQALRNVKVGDQVPAFSLTDLDGNTHTLERYKEKVLLLIFVRPEQETSLEALRVVQRLLRSHGPSGFSALAVSSKPDAKEHFKKLAEERGFTFPIALDPERKMYGGFGLLVSPTTLLVDGAGVLRYEMAHMPPNYERRLGIHLDHLLGKITPEEHDALLEQLKGGKPERADSADRRLGFARTLVEQGKLEQAVAVLTKLRSERESIPAATLLATAYLSLDKVDEAAKCLDPIADTEPAPLALKLALARLELSRDNTDKAEAYLLKALETPPPPGQAGSILFDLGRLYERQGKLARAVECYRKALEATYGNRP
jgi:peroxiredoxin